MMLDWLKGREWINYYLHIKDKARNREEYCVNGDSTCLIDRAHKKSVVFSAEFIIEINHNASTTYNDFLPHAADCTEATADITYGADV